MGKAQHVGRNCRQQALREWMARLTLLSFAMGLFPIIPDAPIQDARAADTSSSGAGAAGGAAAGAEPGLASINPGFDPTMPPQFNMAQIAGQGNLFQNCSGGLQSAIQQSIQSIGSSVSGMASTNAALNASGAVPPPMGFGINAVCPGTDVGPSADSISCENLTLPDGTLDQAALRAKAAAIEMALANVQCKKGKFQAIQGELNCLTTQADMLTQQLTSVQGAYQTNIQRMQQDVQKINTVVADRQSQDADVLTRLTGSPTGADSSGNPTGNGSKGLIGVRDGLCQALTGAACGSTGGGGALSAPDNTNSIPGQIQALKDKMTDQQNAEQSLQEAINQRTMGIAGECFNNRKQPEFQCEPHGPAVSAHDYVLCMYQQRLGVNKNGEVESSASTKGGFMANQNADKAGQLSALLDQIMGDVPQKTQAGPNGQAPDPSQIQASTILTAADVEAQYGADLSKLEAGSGIPIHDVVMKNISYCFQRAERVVRQEKMMASSPIGQQQASLKKLKDQLKTQANQMLSMNVAKYEEAMTALTGMNMPLNTAKCNNATPDVQIACLQDLQQNMEALLHGSAKQTTIKMSIPGTDPRTNIVFTCQGLNGCITALQNVDRNLKQEIKRVTNFKQQYVTAAKQSVDNFTKQMAAMMSGQSAALTNRLKNLNAALSSLGVGGGISIPKVACEKPDVDQDGIPKPPNSAVQLISCQMNPQMLDVSGDNFSSALSNIGQGIQNLDTKLGPLNDARNKLASMPMQCANRLIAKRADALQQDITQMASGNCQYSEEFCKAGNQEAFARLGNSLSAMDTGMGSADLSGAGSSLLSGTSGCSDPMAAANRELLKKSMRCQACMGNTQCIKDAGFDPVAGQNFVCPSAAGGVAAPNTAICNGIAGRLQRDVDRLGAASRSLGGTSAGGAL